MALKFCYFTATLCAFGPNLSHRGVDQTCLFEDMPHCMQADVSLSVMEQLLKKVRNNHA